VEQPNDKKYRVIIAGSRDVPYLPRYINLLDNKMRQVLYEWLNTPMDEMVIQLEIIEGGASGGDHLGRLWAEAYGIPYQTFPADWDKHGKAAGYIRNSQMVEVADALVLIWDGKSKGSANVKSLAEKKGIKIYEIVEDIP
jgi:hypothetical protein